MPQVEVNEENIDRFGLVELTGNSRESMLNNAADAAAKGMVLAVTLPDELLELNIFDIAQSQEPAGVTDQFTANKRCRYEMQVDYTHEGWICIIHGRPSKHNVEADPQAACLAVDPLEITE